MKSKIKNPSINIIVFAKNEEKTIGEVVKKAQKYAKKVLVIDGHSHDTTRKIAQEAGAKVFLDHGRGKGDGIRVGIDRATGEILVLMDADGSHNPRDIPKLLKPIIKGKADIVVGSRMLGGSDELHGTFNKFLRESASHLIIVGINWRFKTSLTDGQNGFRAVKKDVVKKLNLMENITTIEQEMVIKALKRGYRIFEVPTHEYRRKNGTSSIILRKVWWRYLYSWLKNLFF